jgi:endonuclease/exonuclease/phosphatase (EEP) superfamily protein YafD
MRLILTPLGVLAGIGAALAFVVRFLPMTHHVLVVAAVAAPYLMFGAPLAALLLLGARRWLLAVFAVGVTAAAVAVQLPLYIGAGPPPPGAATVRVLTANLGLGEADSVALTALAEQSADVLLVQEMTPEAATGLSAAGLDRTFPHRVLDPRDVASGIGIWSRYPISESAPIEGFSMPLLRARVQVPGVPVHPTVVAIHLGAPWPQPIDGWRDDLARLPGLLRSVAGDSGAVIVAGDFNATMTMVPFRQLLTDGYHDASEQAGAGLARTYPNKPPWPAVIGIDHVLLRRGTATSVRTTDLPGSDHRGLLATVQLPATQS